MTAVARARAIVARYPSLAAKAEQLLYRFPLLHDAVEGVARGNPDKRYAAWVTAYDSPSDADVRGVPTDELPTLSVVVVGADAAASIPDQVFDRFDVRAVEAERCAEAICSAPNEDVVVVDRAATLRAHTLLLVADAFARAPEANLVYGDDDAIAPGGARRDHDFKPDWNESLFGGQDYLGGVVGVRRSHARAVGVSDAVDRRELLVQLTTASTREAIRHVPHVLSHRTEAADLASQTAPQAAADGTKVSIIIPSRCDPGVLGPCLAGLLERTDYAPREVMVVANDHEGNADYVEALRRDTRLRVLDAPPGPYNFSKLNNWAAQKASGELLCFLNDDTEAVRRDWLSALVAQVLQPSVAGVGAMLLYPNGRIQHAGVVLGAGGVAAPAYRGERADSRGYHGRARLTQDVSCVTAACMLVRRRAFDDVGGFDDDLALSYNDVDLCLRLRRAGSRIVWTPDAVLRHSESLSLGRHYAGASKAQWTRDLDLVTRRWGPSLTRDPYYNPNLSLDALELWQPAFPPRVAYPWVRATTANSPVS